MKNESKPLRCHLPVQVPATLRISYDSNVVPDRDATEDDLRRMGYVNALDIYDRLRGAIALLVLEDADADLTGGGWDESNANLIRYLIETGIVYADSPEAILSHLDDGPEDTTMDSLRRLLSASTDEP